LDVTGAFIDSFAIVSKNVSLAVLRNVKFRNTSIRAVDFAYADLRNSDMSYQYCRDVDFTGSDLRHTKLNGSTLRRVRLTRVRTNWVTRMTAREAQELRAVERRALGMGRPPR
jgi:uncharacterized protein YjbI with pentapeptide repeats